ncbi:MAG: phospho-sugar mutase, partial [Chitinispirillaceae bacterium]
QLIREKGKDLTVVFTPLHGTGAMPVSKALEEMGIDVTFVEQQKEPDGDFPTVDYPNPEEASAMKMALDLAKKTGADLVMGTDPDADRLGIAAPLGDEYRLVTGNQLGSLLCDYIFSTRKQLGTLPPKPAFVKTIVTTELQKRIAESYGAVCFDTLTGFKYIGEKIRQFEEQGGELQYVFGGEESYGYLVETQTRDKDAVSAATMTAEMALYYSSQGKTIFDRLNEIYEKYGYFEEKLISKYFKGAAGSQIMNDLMAKLRNDPPAMLGEEKTVLVKDYKTGMVQNLQQQTSEKSIDLPSSNVLQFVLSEGSVVTARPSGTEPKIKFYAGCGTNPGMNLHEARQIIHNRISALEESLRQMIGD